MAMTLRIFVAGRERFARPYFTEQAEAVSAVLEHQLPRLARWGARVTAVVSEENVDWLVVCVGPGERKVVYGP